MISVWAVDFLEAKPLNISWEWLQHVIQEVLAKRRNDLNIEVESLFYVSNKVAIDYIRLAIKLSL